MWEFLVFNFLVFSVYKNHKFSHHLFFLAIFPDLEMLQFWSVNYIFQAYKLYFYFGHVRNFGQHLYLSVFSKQWKCQLLAFVKYMLYSHCTENCIFCTFWRLKTLVLWRKIFQNLLIIGYLCCPKNSTIDSKKNFHNSGTTGCRKLPDPSMICIFNALLSLVYNSHSYFNELILPWSTYSSHEKFRWRKFRRRKLRTYFQSFGLLFGSKSEKL